MVTIYDADEHDGVPYFTMELMEGGSLAQLLKQRSFTQRESAALVQALAEGIHKVHERNIIHRDLKPENILLQHGEPMLADFGIALAVTRAAGDRITESGISLGTPAYMSPEQATGDRTIDGRSDIYSLAAVLYEMLTGDPPYTGHSAQSVIAKVITEPAPSVRAARPNVPEHVATAIARALEKVPADRWQTAGEFADALTGGQRVLAADVPRYAPLHRRRLEKRGILVGVAVRQHPVWPISEHLRPEPDVLDVREFGLEQRSHVSLEELCLHHERVPAREEDVGDVLASHVKQLV